MTKPPPESDAKIDQPGASASGTSRRTHSGWSRSRRLAFVAVSAALLLAALLFAAARIVTEARRNVRSACARGQLSQIGLALRNYYAEHGCFPPAVTYDTAGRPAHSWRVLILPYLVDDVDLHHRKYDFTKPWDSPQNQAFAEAVLDAAVLRFRSQQQANAPATETSFLALNDPSSAWGRCAGSEPSTARCRASW